MDEKPIYGVAPGGNDQRGGLLLEIAPGQQPRVIQIFSTLAEAQDRADELNAFDADEPTDTST